MSLNKISIYIERNTKIEYRKYTIYKATLYLKTILLKNVFFNRICFICCLFYFITFHVERALITPSYIPACDIREFWPSFFNWMLLQSWIGLLRNPKLPSSRTPGIQLTRQLKKVLFSKGLCRRKITASLGFLSSPQSKIEVTFNRRIYTVRIP